MFSYTVLNARMCFCLNSPSHAFHLHWIQKLKCRDARSKRVLWKAPQSHSVTLFRKSAYEWLTYSYRESISTTKRLQTSPLKEDFSQKWKTAENRLALRLSKMESRWVCFFMETALEKCNIPSLDALQWMGAVRMRVQTADKNITIINKQFTWLQSSN